MKEMLARHRQGHKNRFRHETDGPRLMGLGIVLLVLSAVTLADLLPDMRIPGHFGGGSAMFGGIALALHIINIGRPEIYFDWILNALLYVGAGFTLYVDENVTTASSLVLLCTFLFASGAVRIWIGLTAEPQAEAAWILSSGCIAVLAGVWIGATWIVGASTGPALIVAIDSTFQALSIIAFGRSFGELR
jgi:uncharacterized membrane protein HdeD (DUF308 family)